MVDGTLWSPYTEATCWMEQLFPHRLVELGETSWLELCFTQLQFTQDHYCVYQQVWPENVPGTKEAAQSFSVPCFNSDKGLIPKQASNTRESSICTCVLLLLDIPLGEITFQFLHQTRTLAALYLGISTTMCANVLVVVCVWLNQSKL